MTNSERVTQEMKAHKGVAVALAAVILASGGGVATSLVVAQPAQASSTQSEIDAAVTEILNQTNAERANVGLAPLKLNVAMNTVAQNWTQQMATQQSMIHNPDYQTQLPQPWIRVGENVGQGYTKDTIVAAWMASPGHKANILGDFTHIGIGYWIDDAGRGWFTQDFGKYDVPVLTAPNTPTTTVDKFSVNAVWDRKWNENVDDYRADLYAADGQTLLQSKIVPVSNGAVTFDGLTDLTTYSISIVSESTNALGEHFVSPSTTVTATTLEDLPTVTAPTNLSLVPGENSMAAYWNAPASSNGALQPYTVELLDSAANIVATAQTTDPSYTFNGLTSNTGYTVRVTATTAVRTKTASATATLSSTTLLSSVANVSEPTNVTVTSDTFSSLTAKWDAPASQTGMNLKYILTLSTDGKPDAKVETPVSSYTFTGLDQNTAYSVKVQANITAENGVNNATTNGVVSNVRTIPDYDAVAVTAPTLHPVDTHPNYVSLAWDAPATLVGNLDGYAVTVKQAGQPDQVFTTMNTYFTVPNLTENNTYSFEVRANASSLNAVNHATAVSETVSVTTPYAPSTVMVSAPTSEAVAMTSPTSASVTWAAPASLVGNLNGYNVTLTDDGNHIVSTVYVTGLNANFDGLNSGTKYSVGVVATATSPDGTTQAVSDVSSVQFSTDGVQVTAPAMVNLVNLTYRSLQVSWPTPDVIVGKLTGYKVVLKQNGSVVNSYFTESNSYSFDGLNSNSLYTVEVQAVAVSYDGMTEQVSPVVSNTFLTMKSPVATVAMPIASVSNVGTDQFTVSWNRPLATGLITGYKVTVMQGDNIYLMLPLSMFSTSTTINGLNANTAYSVSVEATAMSENGMNFVTAYSTPVNVTTTLVVIPPVVIPPVNPPVEVPVNPVIPPVVTVPPVTPPVVTTPVTPPVVTTPVAPVAPVSPVFPPVGSPTQDAFAPVTAPFTVPASPVTAPVEVSPEPVAPVEETPVKATEAPTENPAAPVATPQATTKETAPPSAPAEDSSVTIKAPTTEAIDGKNASSTTPIIIGSGVGLLLAALGYWLFSRIRFARKR